MLKFKTWWQLNKSYHELFLYSQILLGKYNYLFRQVNFVCLLVHGQVQNFGLSTALRGTLSVADLLHSK